MAPCHNHPKPSRPPSKWPWVCQQNPIARCGSCNLTAGFAAYCCNSSFSTQFVGVIVFFNQAWAKGILHLCHILVANLAWVQEAKCLHHDQQSFPRSGATHRSSRWQTHTPWNTQALGASWPQSVEIGSGVMQVKWFKASTPILSKCIKYRCPWILDPLIEVWCYRAI